MDGRYIVLYGQKVMDGKIYCIVCGQKSLMVKYIVWTKVMDGRYIVWTKVMDGKISCIVWTKSWMVRYIVLYGQKSWMVRYIVWTKSWMVRYIVWTKVMDGKIHCIVWTKVMDGKIHFMDKVMDGKDTLYGQKSWMVRYIVWDKSHGLIILWTKVMD
ncbi:unnamed protein product [Mytilus edulis]|uniref:Uncharacterized protein n=1 Tax=Mytilus edulis TaxID=6550 RepID=A0A8S3QVJ3_MYTED|nr:unnamed protein product [Mytilus edulis]